MSTGPRTRRAATIAELATDGDARFQSSENVRRYWEDRRRAERRSGLRWALAFSAAFWGLLGLLIANL